MEAKKIDDLVFKKLNELRDRIAANIKSTNSSASGMSSQSMVITREQTRQTLSARPFFATLETGRRPGKMPPISKMLEFLAARQIQMEGVSNLKRAWGTAINISKFGTKLFQKGGRKDIYTNEIEKFKTEIYKEVKDALILIVKDELKR